MKSLSIGIRVLLALVALTLVGNGFMWAFLPAGNLETNAISVDSPLGMNMIKSDIGAPLIGVGLLILLYAWRQGHWYYPSVLMAALYAVVRAASVAVDGPEPMALVGVGLETFVVLLLVIDRRLNSAA